MDLSTTFRRFHHTLGIVSSSSQIRSESGTNAIRNASPQVTVTQLIEVLNALGIDDFENLSVARQLGAAYSRLLVDREAGSCGENSRARSASRSMPRAVRLPYTQWLQRAGEAAGDEYAATTGADAEGANRTFSTETGVVTIRDRVFATEQSFKNAQTARRSKTEDMEQVYERTLEKIFTKMESLVDTGVQRLSRAGIGEGLECYIAPFCWYPFHVIWASVSLEFSVLQWRWPEDAHTRLARQL